MKTQLTTILITILVSTTFVSCKKSKRYEINTSKNRIEVKIQRFDKALIQLDTNNIQNSVRKLFTDFPDFFPYYVTDIMSENISDSIAIQNSLNGFLKDTAFIGVNKKTLEMYINVSGIENTLSDAFTIIHYYFPEIKLPQIYFYVSGFNRAVFTFNNFIGIGIDLYLGSDFSKYSEITYQYLTQNMRKEYIPTEILSTLYSNNFVYKSNEDRLLDNILYRGKLMYLLSIALPDEKPEVLMGYSKEQWDWCKTNEKEIWGKIIDQKHLFTTDLQLINKYINNAPFTSPLSQDSPGRVGIWLGWRIIESYMNNNKKISLQDLMRENNYQQILEISGYIPR